MAEAGGGRDAGERRARFESELQVADLKVLEEDREALFAMWADHLPHRESMRRTALTADEDPTFIERPSAGGGL